MNDNTENRGGSSGEDLTGPLVGPAWPRSNWTAAHAQIASPDRFAAFAAPVRPEPVSAVRSVGLAVQVLLAVVTAAGVAKLVGAFGQLRLLQQLTADPTSVTFAQAESSDRLQSILSIIWIARYLITAIVFVVWFYKIRFNAGTWAPHAQRRSQGWSIGGWICPVVWLWFPFQIAADALESARPDDGDYWSGVALLRWWWAAWLLQYPLEVLSRVGRDAQIIGPLILRAQIELADDAVFLAAGVLAILVVRRITALQHQKITQQEVALGWQSVGSF